MNRVFGIMFLWLYRIFLYFIPLGIFMWGFVISKMIDGSVSFLQKIGICGIMTIGITFVICLIFVGKAINSKIEKLTNSCIECVDVDKKKKLVLKKRAMERMKDRFQNILFVLPFVLVWLTLSMVEKGILSLRGVFLAVVISMGIGLIFGEISRHFVVKELKKNGDSKI